MFLPWSIFGRGNKKTASAQARKPRRPTGSAQRKGAVEVEALEDRTLLRTYFVDVTNPNPGNGDADNPFKTIQQAVRAANLLPGPDHIIVYGNNSTNPQDVYVWRRDGDADGDGVLDGNMVLRNVDPAFPNDPLASDPNNTVSITFLAQTSNLSPTPGVPARVIVKLQDNIIDVGTGTTFRVEGSVTAPVIFTSFNDDSAGGDTNNDGETNLPSRADWGGIRFRANAVDQGSTFSNGALINFADLRFFGQTVFDVVANDVTEFAGIRMEASQLTGANAQIRVWNTVFRNGGRAIEMDLNTLGGTGPDLGNATLNIGNLGPQPLLFQNNSINGAFIGIPFVSDPTSPNFGRTVPLRSSAQLDDVGVPYVLTQRMVLNSGVVLTVNQGMIIKSQRVAIDGIDQAEATDTVFGTIQVNGTPELPVLFTSLTDDNIIIPGTRLGLFYNNGTADTNNDGNATTPQPGDWGGVRIAQGNIDYAVFRYGGGLVPIVGQFTNVPPITVFARDRTPIGGTIQSVRVANTEVAFTFSGVVEGQFYDSPAIELFSRDWGDNRLGRGLPTTADPVAAVVRTGDVAIIDNYIHDNQGKAIDAHPLHFHERKNPFGGYGVHFARNTLQNNVFSGVYIRFQLLIDPVTGLILIDRNLPRFGGYFDDTDIAMIIDGQANIVYGDQAFQMMSRRGVVPSLANGGFLERFTTEAAFHAGLVQRLPGINPIPLERLGTNISASTIVDAGLFYHFIDFGTTARNGLLPTLAQDEPANVRGTEWRDRGVNFVNPNSNEYFSFLTRGVLGAIDADPIESVPTGPNILTTADPTGNGSFDMVFPNAVSAVGFFIVDNETTSPYERIELYGIDNNLIETIAMPRTFNPATGVNAPVYVGRVSKQPIYRVRIVEDADDVVGGQRDYTGPAVPILDTQATAAATIAISSPFTITDLDVTVNINHPRASDLEIVLEGPDGTRVTLANRTGGSGTTGANYTNTYFDQSGAVSITAGLAPFSGIFRPVGNLNAFNGKNAQGNWRLLVTDRLTGPGNQTGQIVGFTLNFKSGDLPRDTMGIDNLTYVDAPQSLVVKAVPSPITRITAGSVSPGYGGAIPTPRTDLVVNFQHNARPVVITGSGANATATGVGATLRILGQPLNPVIITSLADDSVGTGTVGNVVFDSGNDGPSTGSPGDWTGIQILAGVNTSKVEVVTQQANGSVNRRYADTNPYTLGDEPATYPTPSAAIPSYQDQFNTGLGNLAINATPARANIQDGTLIEHTTIRYATTGIEQVGYPASKLSIDGNEVENQPLGPDDWSPIAAPNVLVNPIPDFTVANKIIYGADYLTFDTQTGFYRVGGKLGGRFQFTTTDDVDWYELPQPPGPTQIYIQVERGNATDAPGGPVAIAVFNRAMQLLYWSSSSTNLGLVTPPATAGNSGGALGPIDIHPGDVGFNLQNDPRRDATYVAIFPNGRIPAAFVPTDATDENGNAGLLGDGENFTFTPLPAAIPGSNGYSVQKVGSDGMPVDMNSNDFIWDPPGASGAALLGYEAEFSVFYGPNIDRGFDPPRQSDGELLIRYNTISDSAGSAISLTDYRTTGSNTNLGTTMPTQSGRFHYPNQVNNSNGTPFANPDIFIPGPQVYNNLIYNNSGNGITQFETLTDGDLNLLFNLPNPTAFTQIINNTIDQNGGAGVSLSTRGGPNVINNIITRNGVGLNIADPILAATGREFDTTRPPILPVASYNLFQNTADISAGSQYNGTQNLFNSNPQFVDAGNRDYRVFSASAAVDSALSSLSDRLASARFPQEPTRAPTDDFRRRDRVDNPLRNNVGAGQFPFYDRGAYETNELSLRVVALSVFSPNAVLGAPVSQLVVRFAGRVDPATVNSSTVFLRRNSATGPIVPLGIITNSYNALLDQHTFTIPLSSTLLDGTYHLLFKGTVASSTDVAIRDVAGQLLDGEFGGSFPTGNGTPGGNFVYAFNIRLATIDGLVWNNANGNLTQDPGEPGLPNVKVDLRNTGPDGVFGTADDVIFPSVNTNSQGRYSFGQLPPGIYQVRVDETTIPQNFGLNTPPNPRVITVAVGETVSNVNFGYIQDLRNAEIGDLVWSDLNGDGLRNAGEPGLANVAIDLTWAGPDRLFGTVDDQFFSTISDSTGVYRFVGLPGGLYRAAPDLTTLPPGFVQTAPATSPVVVDLSPGQKVTTVDFGFQERSGQIGDLVFNDLNGNGVFDPGEPGIANVTVRLASAGIDGIFGTADDPPVRTATTNISGGYVFGGLTAGLYRVTVDLASVPLANFYLTTNNNPIDINLPDGRTIVDVVDFGFRLDPRTGVVGDLVFDDVDGDGVFNAANGDLPLDGVTLQLVWAGRNGIFGDADDTTFPTVTSGGAFGAGRYQFTNLPVGRYRIDAIAGVPPTYGRTTPATAPFEFFLPGDNPNTPVNESVRDDIDFGFQQRNSSISGIVWGDVNGDGVVDPIEATRFTGVRVFIDLNNNDAFDADEPFGVSLPGSGAYTISSIAASPPGGYKVMIDPQSIPATPTGLARSPLSRQIVVLTNQDVNNLNGTNSTSFGLQQRNAIVRGQVFRDMNQNGELDPGEGGINNIGMRLTWFGLNGIDEGGFGDDVVFTTTTTVDGSYAFTGLAGNLDFSNNYRVEVDVSTLPPNSSLTTPNPVTLNLPVGATQIVNFGSTAVAGVQPGLFYFTVPNGTRLRNSNGTFLTARDTDIIKVENGADGGYNFSVYFRGSDVGLTPGGTEGIGAFTILNDGSILIATRGSSSVRTTYPTPGSAGTGATISVFGEDIRRFVPTQINGPTAGTWSWYFDGSDVLLSGAAERIDGLAVLYKPDNITVDRLLISTAGSASVSGLNFKNYDVVAFTPNTLGANTSGTFSMYINGARHGLNDAIAENVNGIAALPDPDGGLPIIYLTTNGNYSVPGLSGTRSDIFQFTMTKTGQFSEGAFGPKRFQGANFGITANVGGLFAGNAPGANPLMAAGAATGTTTDLETKALRWNVPAVKGVSSVNVFVDTASMSADQAARVRDALAQTNRAWQRGSNYRLVEVANPVTADIRITVGELPGAGHLGNTEFSYDIAISGFLANATPFRAFLGHATGGQVVVTLDQTQDWYAGRDPKGIRPDQFDFQSVVTHELGHALGLGHAAGTRQVMSEELATGVVRRQFTAADVAALTRQYTTRSVVPPAVPGLDRATLNQLTTAATKFVKNLPKTDVNSLVQSLAKAPLPAGLKQQAKTAVDNLFTALTHRGGRPTSGSASLETVTDWAKSLIG